MSVSTTLALSGGVGGAKLSLGLAQELPPGALHVLANTGDDFEHMGLTICPDIDTLLYTLSGRANTELGWGLDAESWNAMAALEQLGGETWFRLGDKDLATHLWRSSQLARGQSLSAVTAQLTERMGITSRIYPMTDSPVRTVVQSDEGDLAFQHYFVRRQCEPAVSGFYFKGIAQASVNKEILEQLQQQTFARIVICPSNPFVSIDPILQLPDLWRQLKQSSAPVILVSPIVAGMAIKGPAAKMMAELNVPVTALGVAQHYTQRYPGLLDYFVIDSSDQALAADIAALGLHVITAPTIMKTLEDKQQLARLCLSLESL